MLLKISVFKVKHQCLLIWKLCDALNFGLTFVSLKFVQTAKTCIVKLLIARAP